LQLKLIYIIQLLLQLQLTERTLTTPIEPGEVVDKFALTGPHKLHFLR